MNDVITTGMMYGWQETQVWQMLKEKHSPEAESVRTTLKQCMPDIQRILAQGGTSPTDFTLHDSNHSYRVAELMTQVIPSDVLPKLTTYELALLLLSAYLHDIGMTPEARKVNAHHQYVLTGDRQQLSNDEIEEFQKWLDNQSEGILPPLSKGQPTIGELRLADELITHYCRNRHVDWSEEWIHKNLTGYRLATYDNWVDDLARLCKSHRQSYHDLLQNAFDPRIVGAPAAVVHLRYLAVVLRFADTLDFDPERVPDVILRHRDIARASLIYWWKDPQISMLIDDNRPIISARPANARVHKAIESTINQIDDELRLCRSIADETHFEVGPGLHRDLPHRWDLLSSAHRDIKPKEGTYEYVNGSFRPDTKKLLALLSGIETYGDPLSAVRELLQNAFDAVNEQIAYQRLAQTNPHDPSIGESIRNVHSVSLRLEVSGDDAWLICVDTGVGMTKAIIENHLLVSGAAKRHDILELDRRCKAAGFQLGRSGQFGIGVLSYFMLASQVELKTRRSPEPGDAEQAGWYFVTDGVGSFGELRRDATLVRGTVVRIQLLQKVIGENLVDWFFRLRQYLKRTLLYVPCRFEFSSSLAGCETLEFELGWTFDLNDDFFSDGVLRALDRKHGDKSKRLDIVSDSRRRELVAETQSWEEMRTQARQCLRWQTKYGDLPEGFGTYRIHLPYFELRGGPSLAFLPIMKDSREFLLDEQSEAAAYLPYGQTRLGWKGMSVSLPGPTHSSQGNQAFIFARLGGRGTIVEVNWSSSDAGTIGLMRNEIILSKKGIEICEWVKDIANKMIDGFLTENDTSSYSLLNRRLEAKDELLEKPLCWIMLKGTEPNIKGSWQPLSYPLTHLIGSNARDDTIFLWKGKQVHIAPHIKTMTSGSYSWLHWNHDSVSPNRIVLLSNKSKFRLVALWTGSLRHRRHVAGMTSLYPPMWRSLVGATLTSWFSEHGSAIVWNAHHPIINAIEETGWAWCSSTFDKSHDSEQTLDPLPHREKLLSDRSHAAAWVVWCLERGVKDIWDGLKDRDPSFLSDLWQVLLGASARLHKTRTTPIYYLADSSSGVSLVILNHEGWTNYKDDNAIRRFLPKPKSDWCVVTA